jgi:AcrR family transcriptional regulator
MRSTRRGSLAGRRAEALRNDERILRAAREVLMEEGFEAPMAAIARRAGVGVGTLYRRYPSKEQLAREMSIAGMDAIAGSAREALEDADREPRDRFADFVRRCAAEGAGELLRLAGHFPPTPEQQSASRRLRDAVESLLAEVRRAGQLSPDLTAADVYLLFAQLQEVTIGDRRRDAELRRRYAELMLRGLVVGEALPGRPPAWAELERLWNLDPGLTGQRRGQDLAQ